MNEEANIVGDATPREHMPEASTAEPNVLNLVRLEEMNNCHIGSGDPDPCGWDVKARDGRKVGTVTHLIVDSATLRVRFLEVELDAQPEAGENRSVYVPISTVQLSDDAEEVIVERGDAAIMLLDAANRDRAAELSDAADDVRFFGQRHVGRDEVQYLVRRESRY